MLTVALCMSVLLLCASIQMTVFDNSQQKL